MSDLTEHLRQLDKRHIWHPFTHMRQWMADDPLIITAAEGMHLIDSDGKRYLDAVSSLWCNVHGHRVPEIDQAIRAQLDKVAHTTMLGLANEPATLLADRLIRIVPKNLAKVFYSDSGATAAEVAFKLAVQYWHNIGKSRKNEFVGFTEAYHGDTVGAMSIGRTEAFHRPYFPLLFKAHFAPTPFAYRMRKESAGREIQDGAGTARHDESRSTPPAGNARPTKFSLAETEQKISIATDQSSTDAYLSPSEAAEFSLRHLRATLELSADSIVAICIEPIVQGAAGMIVHPPGFLSEVRRLATEFDVLLIADEVAVGFGRTGKMFACEHEGVEPDLLCVGKGITGGYLPLAATFATQKIFDAFLGEPWEGRTFFHGHTSAGNPLAAAAALASLDLFERNQVVRDVDEKSRVLATMLDDLRDLPHVGDIRQKGFMVGIELVADKATRRSFDPKKRVGAALCMRCRRHGVIVRPLGDVIVLMPPPAMGVEDLRTIVTAVGTEIAEKMP